MEMRKVTVKGSWEKTFLVPDVDLALKHAKDIVDQSSPHIKMYIHGFYQTELNNIDN
jgi:hypothetical protein